MKKLALLTIMLFLSFMVVNAENVKTVKLSFSKQQFSFLKNSVGATEIVSYDLDAGYDSDTSLPGLPLVAVNIGVPNGTVFCGVEETVEKQLLFDDIVVAANPVSVPTNYEGPLPKSVIPTYLKDLYPERKVQYVCTSKMDGYTILRFLVCPFEYDAKNKKLYLANSISFDIKLNANKIATYSDNAFVGNNMREVVLDQIINADEFVKHEVSPQNIEFLSAQSGSVKERYLILTSKYLAPYFKPLASWKTMKGVKTYIANVEDIIDANPDMDAPLAIKAYLERRYLFNNVKYVLLGGDDTVVPVRECYVEGADSVETYNMPTDLYYACFDGEFNWDHNGNGIYGEKEDSISMDPSIIVTRIPVRSSDDVDVFVKRTIAYERNPVVGEFSNTMLMAGNVLGENIDGTTQSDSEGKGERLYERSIAPYWDGKKMRFYDTNTDFSGGADYDLTIDNLQYQLSQGYSFVDMITHGSPTAWKVENNKLYTTAEANTLTNKGYSVIVTSACLTNAFDDNTDPCLSESFVRNPNSGVVAYLGCSREGWNSFGSPSIGTSLAYSSTFYQKLFGKEPANKNFGTIVAMAKNRYVVRSKSTRPVRWVQFGLNPIGDPEMPIYTTKPKFFKRVCIKIC